MMMMMSSDDDDSNNSEEEEEVQPTTSSAGNDLMKITPEERERAVAIKQAVEACDEVENLSDFECVKLAICCGADKTIEQIVEMAWKLQQFRQQYQLQETLEDAMYTLRQFFHFQPGLLMDVSYVPTEQCYTSSSDIARMNFQQLQTDEQYRAFQGGCYYWIRSMETDFTSIRNGIIVLNECEGMSMLNFNIAAQERCVAELWAYYPARHKESIWLNAPTAAIMFYGIMKRIVNTELLQSWKLSGGLEGYEGRRLDTLFSQPTPEIAQEALLQRMKGYLQQRYYNIQTFSL